MNIPDLVLAVVVLGILAWIVVAMADLIRDLSE